MEGTEEKATPTLQSYFESGELKWLDNTKSIEALLPYDSISLERGPCFGPCPVYTVTFYRDGHAVLVTDPLLPDHRKRYTGRIWPEGYARLTQLVTSEKIGAPKGNYAGQWTDDSRSIVRATSDGKTWEASDYGEVSPPELWVLIEILHVVREQVEWSPAKGAGG